MSINPKCSDNTDDRCSKPGGKIVRGLCDNHYYHRRKAGTLPSLSEYRKLVYDPACLDNGDGRCAKPGSRTILGLCENHYRVRERAGTIPEPTTCKLCGGPIRSDNVLGICLSNPECRRAHGRAYRQQADRPCKYAKTRGCPEFARIGSSACREHGNEDRTKIGYSAAHLRADKVLPQECATADETCCGRLEIAFRHDAPAEFVRVSTGNRPGRLYYVGPNPADGYMRLCCSHHKRMDLPPGRPVSVRLLRDRLREHTCT